MPPSNSSQVRLPDAVKFFGLSSLMFCSGMGKSAPRGHALPWKADRHLDGRRRESRPESVGRNGHHGRAARDVDRLRRDMHRSRRKYEVGRLVEAEPSAFAFTWGQ